jgi:hypothetical protein
MGPRAKLKILFEVKVRESEKIIEKILFSNLNCVYVFLCLKRLFWVDFPGIYLAAGGDEEL